MTTVLVTGVGAVTGYGILRTLRKRRPELRLVGIDTNADAVGAHWCSRFVTCPPTIEPSYLQWLHSIICHEHVDLVLPTLDADLDLFRATGAAAYLTAALALNSDTALAMSRDKLELDRQLAAHDDPARIPTSTSTDFDELRASLGAPFLLKARRGYGSRGIVTIADPIEFEHHAPHLPDDLIAQQMVGRDDDEYTVGAFGDGHDRFCARIVMRRTLFPWGTTRRVEVVDASPDLDATIDRLAPIIAPQGPTNLQFRRSETGAWMLLEVNARVSSSASLRDLFGYREAEMAIDYYLEGEVPAQPEIRTGSAVRYLEDLITT